MKFELVEVNDLKGHKDFISAHVLMNKGEKNWIRPLDNDIAKIFDPKKNRFYRHGETIRWVLKSSEGEILGRIAAFINSRYKNRGDSFKVGGMGFFDCIDNQECANLLFDSAKSWLENKGMQAMDGPINFGERNNWWGLLVDGFYPPIYGMNFNPPYYQELFETYGFKNYYDQICWSLEVKSEPQQFEEKFYTAYNKYSGDKDFSAKYADKNNIEKLASDFCHVYNQAWANHGENKEMKMEAARNLFKSLKPVLDSHILWFAYYKDEPISMWLNIPDLNMIFKSFNGQLNWLRKLQFKYLQLTGRCSNFVGIIFGVIPEFQKKGIDYYMIIEAEKEIKRRGKYKHLEMMWEGDFNPKILGISRNLGATHTRTLVTYRYIFDQSIPFNRHPIIE